MILNSSIMETKDAFTEVIEVVEDDFYKFNEIVNQNLRIESDIERQLEKEDRKCTFLKHTIEDLKKQLDNAEKICIIQSNFIYEQQMELEDISSKIFEQMESQRIAYPEEDAEPYREMYNVVQRMVDYITNFKLIIQQNIDDCVNRGEEISYWKNKSNQLLTHVSQLEMTKNELRQELNYMESRICKRSSEKILESIINLQEVHSSFKTKKNRSTEISVEKERLRAWKTQMITESENMTTSSLNANENCQKLKRICADMLDKLQVEITTINRSYTNMLNEMELLLNVVEKELDKLKCIAEEKSSILKDTDNNLTVLKIENKKIISSIEKLDSEKSQLEKNYQQKSITVKTYEQRAINKVSSLQKRINAIKIALVENEVRLKNLTEEMKKLQNFYEAMGMNYNDSQEISIEELKTNLENLKIQNDQLEKEQKKSEQEMKDLHITEEELKCDFNACIIELDFLNVLHNQVSTKIDEEHSKISNKVDEKIEKCIENINEFNNVLMENNLLLDLVKVDVGKFFKLIPSIECKIKAKNVENAEKTAKLSQIMESIANEEKNLQNKIKLFEELEKNTFPKHKIPTDWLQSLEQHKSEYEKFKNERIELEEKRNNLKKLDKEPMEKNGDMQISEIFRDTDPKKQRITQEMKSAAYKMFKERIMKKNNTPLFD